MKLFLKKIQNKKKQHRWIRVSVDIGAPLTMTNPNPFKRSIKEAPFPLFLHFTILEREREKERWRWSGASSRRRPTRFRRRSSSRASPIIAIEDLRWYFIDPWWVCHWFPRRPQPGCFGPPASFATRSPHQFVSISSRDCCKSTDLEVLDRLEAFADGFWPPRLWSVALWWCSSVSS